MNAVQARDKRADRSNHFFVLLRAFRGMVEEARLGGVSDRWIFASSTPTKASSGSSASWLNL
jgi:hypothetical protein